MSCDSCKCGKKCERRSECDESFSCKQLSIIREVIAQEIVQLLHGPVLPPNESACLVYPILVSIIQNQIPPISFMKEPPPQASLLPIPAPITPTPSPSKKEYSYFAKDEKKERKSDSSSTPSSSSTASSSSSSLGMSSSGSVTPKKDCPCKGPQPPK